MIRLLLALAILVTMAAPAFADPVSIVFGLTAGLLTYTGITGTALLVATYAISTAILAGGTYLLNAALAPNQKIDPGRSKDTFEAEEASELRAIGRVRLGGLVAFGSTNGVNRYRLVLHARSLDGVEDHFLGGFEVIRDDTGAVLSKPYRISSTNYIHLKTELGSATKTAWPDLMAAFPALWTNDHRARGVAQTLIRYVSPGLTSALFLRLYQGGPPAYQVVARGERLYDPRTDATVWSDNGILAILHVALSFTRFSLDDFDLDQIADEADLADATVTTLAGSEPRARAWGVWASEGRQAETLAQLLQSVGAEFFTTDGDLIGIRLIDDDRAADLEIDAKHVVALDWRAGPESVERPNRLRLKYYSPERRYEMTEIDLSGQSWARVDSEIEAVGEQVLDVDLPFCPSASQAQRIGRRLFHMARGDRGVVVTNMVGMAAWGLRVVDVAVPDLETSLHCAILPPRARDSDGTVEIPFVVLPDLATWAPATMEAPAPIDVPEIVYAGAADAPPAFDTACVVTYPDASIETRVSSPVALGDVSFTPIANGEIAYRTVNPLPSEWRQMTPYALASPRVGYLVGLDLTGIPSVFRQRGSNSDSENTEWSPLFAATPAQVNTATAPPVVAYVAQIEITAPLDLHVAYVRVTPPSSGATNYPVRPGQVLQFPAPLSGLWQATAHTSNGTSSTTASAAAP